MTSLTAIHPDNPQSRLIEQVVKQLKQGDVVAYPTDSDYALGCTISNKGGVDRIRRIRNLPKAHHFTLLCRDLSEIATYARIDNIIFRFLKAHTPGPYTFILPATRRVPRQLPHAKRKTIGVRIPKNRIITALLAELGEPLMSASLILPDDQWPLTTAEEIEHKLTGLVDVIVDGGACGMDATTVVDLTSGVPEVIRAGKGKI